MRAAYPEKHTKRVRRSSAADLFCMRQVSGAGPDGPRRPARFTMPGMNALARLRPGSSCCPPAGAARQRKGTKRIIAPAAQGPRPSAVHLPRHAASPFAPCHRCRRRNPAYHESAVHGRAGPAGGGNEKPRIPEAKPSGSYSAYGWAERSPRRIPRPWPAPPSGGLRGGGNSFQRFSSSVQPKSL